MLFRPSIRAWPRVLHGVAVAAVDLQRIVGIAPSDACGQKLVPSIPLYSGKPWFLPAIGGIFRALDWFDERIR